MKFMKNVLITGATGGIGKSLVSKFNKNGFNVCATGTNTEKLSELDRKYGKNIKCIRCDLSNENEVENVLVMIDDENGNLADEDDNKRNDSIEMHKNWINAAAEIGCSSARLNLYGSKNIEIWKSLSMDSLAKLGEHANSLNINVIVENHGRITSNIPELMDVIYGVNMDNVGTLPDFGNFCMADEGYGSVFDGTCATIYDFYKGVEEMMPKAFAVSAKSNDFDENGDEKTIDYTKMLKIVKSFGYTGYIGVEYEGERLSEVDGIIATRDLLVKVGQSI